MDLELKTVEKRVLSELGNAHLKQAIHITATGAKAAASNTEYKEPGGKSMIMIFDDGTVRADYGFMPVGPLILTRAEFEKLITTLLDRASTEPLIRRTASGRNRSRLFQRRIHERSTISVQPRQLLELLDQTIT